MVYGEASAPPIDKFIFLTWILIRLSAPPSMHGNKNRSGQCDAGYNEPGLTGPTGGLICVIKQFRPQKNIQCTCQEVFTCSLDAR